MANEVDTPQSAVRNSSLGRRRFAWIAATAIGLVAWSALCAQPTTVIKTDNSWGRTARTLTPADSATTITGNRGTSHDVPGSVYKIPQTMGQLKGANLFHSFERFSVGARDAAVFATTIPLNNVISRVSGSSPTTVNGLLMLKPENGGAPNFFFINPAGVTFGAGAQVDVPSALYVSTANRLRFADGTVFAAGSGSDSTLTMAPPEAFGFLGKQSPARVSFNNRDASGKAGERPNIALAPGALLNITAGEVQFDSVDIAVPEGMLRVAAAGNDTVEVPVSAAVGVPLRGAIEANSAKLATTNVGTILLEGGSMTFCNGTEIFSENSGAHPAGPITIVSSGDIFLDSSFLGSTTNSVNSSATSSPVSVEAAGHLSVGDSFIFTETDRAADAGTVDIGARALTIAGRDISSSSGIISISVDGSQGSAGAITVDVTDTISILQWAEISSNTRGRGQSGSIDIHARSLAVDVPEGTFGGISSQSHEPACGDAGSITIKATDSVSVLNWGRITSNTFGSGDAGTISIEARSVTIDGNGTFAAAIFSSSEAAAGGNAGPITIEVADAFSILNRGRVSARTLGSGLAGKISVRAGSLTIDAQGANNGIFSTAGAPNASDAGAITIKVEDTLSLLNGGAISANTRGSGAAGAIDIQAGALTIDGAFAGIVSAAETGSTGDGGTIVVDVTDGLSLLKSGQIASVALGTGAAGSIDIQARSLTIDGRGMLTAIGSQAGGTASRDAGALVVNVTENLSILNQGLISSSTFGLGSAGDIHIKAHSLTIDGRGVSAPEDVTGIGSTAQPGSLGEGGAITIRLQGSLSILSGHITSGTFGPKAAGAIDVQARSVTIHGGEGAFSGIASQAQVGSGGDAGAIAINVTDNILVHNDGRISSSTFGSGAAGDIDVRAGSLTIDGEGLVSGIFSESVEQDTGNGGAINLVIDETLRLVDSAQIGASTWSGRGHAGNISVEAAEILIDGPGTGIFATANSGSSGSTGGMSIHADEGLTLSNGGTLSIRNSATVDEPEGVKPALLSIFAPDITLKDASITAQSTGNIAASSILVSFTDRLFLDPSRITTSANQGNGGAIDIGGGRILWLNDSEITSSVSGLSGDGGDIAINAKVLLMQSGFIQANTAGTGASGGNVAINVQALVPIGTSLTIGGDAPLVFQPGVFGPNVIQAAAPTGVSGTIHVATPALDVFESLKGLTTEVIASVALGRDLCRVSGRSSLTPVGRGGLRPTSSGMIRPDGAVVLAQSDGNADRHDRTSWSGKQDVAAASSVRCEY